LIIQGAGWVECFVNQGLYANNCSAGGDVTAMGVTADLIKVLKLI
jgi:homoserine dehydrogenase